jgi:hypothetical protein
MCRRKLLEDQENQWGWIDLSIKNSLARVRRKKDEMLKEIRGVREERFISNLRPRVLRTVVHRKIKRLQNLKIFPR